MKIFFIKGMKVAVSKIIFNHKVILPKNLTYKQK